MCAVTIYHQQQGAARNSCGMLKKVLLKEKEKQLMIYPSLVTVRIACAAIGVAQGGVRGLKPPTPILEGAKPLHFLKSIYSNRAVSYSNRAVIH